MTAWTTPTTWASGNTPTAANFNQQIRDNMLHLREGIDALGFAYNFDPRINPVGGSPGFEVVAYTRGWGRCSAVRAIRIRVSASSGEMEVGFYNNAGEGMLLSLIASRPETLKDSSGSLTVPAIGTADILMSSGAAEFEPGDWFAIGIETTGGAAAIYSGPSASDYVAGGRGWWGPSGSHSLSNPANLSFARISGWLMLAIT